MDKKSLSKLYTDQNPALAGSEGSITISRAHFWKFFDLTYAKAYEDGRRDGAKAQRLDYIERVKQSVRHQEMMEADL